MFFLNLPSGARCAGRDGKAAEPVHAGPPVGNHLIAVSEPCRRSARGEIRDPKPDGASLEPLKGQDCRSRARRGPSEISIPWDPSPGPAGSMGCRRERQRSPKPSGARESRARKGSVETAVSRDPSPWQAVSMGCRRERQRIPKPSGARESRARKGFVETHVSRDPSPWPAGSMGCRWERRSPLEQGSPGRGKVPSRLMSPKPKSMAGWQHGLPAGTAANSEALLSRGVQGEEGFRRDSCLRSPSPWPAGSTGCRWGRLPPSWCGFRTRYETQGV